MSLDLSWRNCPDVERLNTEPQRWISFACGVVMMNAEIGSITEETLPELLLWQRVVEDGSSLVIVDAKPYPLQLSDWFARLGMTANVRTETKARRRTALHNRMLEQSSRDIDVEKRSLVSVGTVITDAVQD